MNAHAHHIRRSAGTQALLSTLAALLALASAPAPAAQPSGGVTRLRAFSTAAGHEPIEYGLAGESSAILVDDAVLRQPIVPAGLRAAVAQQDGLTRAAFFQLADRPGDLDQLARFIDSVAPGEALVLAVHRSIAPAPKPGVVGPDPQAAADRRERLADLLGRIGAEASAIDRRGVSWAYIGLRLESSAAADGQWVRLAESISTETGVSLSFLLSADRGRYVDYPSTLLREGASRLRLMDQWPSVRPMPDTAVLGAVEIGGRGLPAILAHPPYLEEVLAAHPHGENRIRFDAVSLGESPRFECSIGLRPESHGQSDGVTFSLAVDDQVVASRTLTAAADQPPAWHDWNVDLAGHAGRTVTLELRTAPNQTTLFDHAFWGDPVIVCNAAPAAQLIAPDEHRLVFVGHAYPINGFDKRTRPSYLGWNTADETYAAQGQSLRRRLQVENWAPARQAFYAAIQATQPDRLVWGGDAMYTPGPAEAAHLSGMLAPLGDKHVVLPGNHDFPLAADPSILEHCAASAGQDETIGGVRLIYLDTIQSGQAIIVDDASACAPDRAWIAALQARLHAAAADPEIYGLIVAMHHAPWLTEPGVANVAHASDWWAREIHPALRTLAHAGVSVVVLAGDAGDHCMADGRGGDGVQYIVTGQPRFDGDVSNGFVEVAWGPSRPGLTIRVHGWTWGRPPQAWEPQSADWQY